MSYVGSRRAKGVAPRRLVERPFAHFSHAEMMRQLVPGRISVVMPCFNAEIYIAEAIESVLGQTYRDVELIVVEDGSRDSTPHIVKKYGSRILALTGEGKGPYPARNRGIAAASGEFLAFLDADDYWDARCLQELHEALMQKEADLAYCGWQNVGSYPGGREPYVPHDYMAGDPVLEFLQSCPWPIHAALTRRAVIDGIGGFSERRHSAMDYDLWLRVLGATRRMVRVPKVLAFYRWHEHGQISSNKWPQVLDAREARAAFAARQPHLIAATGAQVRSLVNEPVCVEARNALWRNDLCSAQKLFRASLLLGAVHWKDAKYIVASLFPSAIFQRLVRLVREAGRRPVERDTVFNVVKEW